MAQSVGVGDTAPGIKEDCYLCDRIVYKKKSSCINCLKVFHNSCAEKANCCPKKSIINVVWADVEEQEVQQVGHVDLVKENKELKATINNLEVIIKDLKLELQSSKNEIESLNDQQKNKIKYNQERNMDDYVTRAEVSQSFNKIFEELECIKKEMYERTSSSSNINDRENRPVPTINKKVIVDNEVSSKKHQELINKQAGIMNRIINLDKGSSFNDDNNEDFIKVVHKKTNNKMLVRTAEKKVTEEDTKSYAYKLKFKPVVGNSSITSLVSVPKTYIDSFHVTRLHPDTTVQSMIQHLSTINKNVECVKLNSKKPDVYSSFKITIPRSCRESIMNSDFWPKGVTINTFFQKRKVQDGLR